MRKNKLPEIIEVDITENHITNGRRTDYSRCPVALALKEKLNAGENWVVVFSREVCIKYGTSYYWYVLDKEVTNFISEFDRGKCVRPFKARLERKYGE